MLTSLRALTLGVGLSLAACSGGGGGGTSPSPSPSPVPTPTPTPTPTPSPDFSAVSQAIDGFSVQDVTVLVGDDTGVLFTYSRGNVTPDTAMYVASATKMVFGLSVWQLIEDGRMSRTDNPQDYISFWASISGDARATVTLDQLMGFVSGFNADDTAATCIGDGAVTLSDCVQSIHDGGLDVLPGSAFYYGPEHMQIAALMMQNAIGQPAPDIMRSELFDPAGLSAITRFTVNLNDNPRYAGSLISTANDYALLLQGVLDGSLVTDLSGYLEDRTASVTFGRRPDGITDNSYDWHYGWGFWIECDTASFQASCLTNPTISSAGAFGFLPWIDFETGYWGIIAIEEAATANFRPASVSVQLEQELQPLIEAALTP